MLGIVARGAHAFPSTICRGMASSAKLGDHPERMPLDPNIYCAESGFDCDLALLVEVLLVGAQPAGRLMRLVSPLVEWRDAVTFNESVFETER